MDLLRGGTVPTKYIDKNGKEISDDSWDLSNIDATVITKIGFHVLQRNY
nr:hypothetical protein [Mycoplasmopsis bovis]